MPCFHPLQAWRTQAGEVVLGKEQPDSLSLQLPCGSCLGCNSARARAWALRNHLEMDKHDTAAFSTLTYAEENLPPTLQKRHVQLWLKRLRKAAAKVDQRFRFFASGEYGETFGRPHYHAILYGLSPADADLIEDTWQLGFVRTLPVTPGAIEYVAGYTAKKIGWKQRAREERVDPTTGEVYTWQPPFLQMSRRPGIGGNAREFTNSWRAYAIHAGQKMPVPRYLHEAWRKGATKEEIDQLIYEKAQLAKLITKEQIAAQERIAIRRQELENSKRKLA